MTTSTLTSADERTLLLRMARESIEHGLIHGSPLPVDPVSWKGELRVPAATFVTLLSHGELRGCIGRLEAVRPLIEDVVDNAFSAAFRDPRFPPVSGSELKNIKIHLSILGPAEPLEIGSEDELLEVLEPGIDGLILDEKGRRATFLPSVWESLKDKREFVRHLKQKAGLPENYWSPTLRAYRYRTESFSEVS